MQGVEVAKELFAKKKIKNKRCESVIDQVQQGKKRLVVRKKTLAAPKFTTKEVLSTPVGAGAGPVTRPFERKGFRAPRFLVLMQKRFIKRSTKAERIKG